MIVMYLDLNVSYNGFIRNKLMVLLKGEKEMKRLYKSTDRKICGVCGGIAEYFDIDPTVIRLIWVVFTLLGGSGILAYIIAAVIMDDNPGWIENKEEKTCY
jgi:phage shock protein PspC (stress-responsive transcriptional regulator)